VLAGDSAGDAVYAERHKVSCVAIDYDISNVNTFRKTGGVAVQDSLQNQIMALTPDCVIADCVNGITVDNIALLLDAITVCDAVVLNLLRGRDPVGGDMVKQMQGFAYTVPHYKRGDVVVESIEKHRGKMAALLIAAACNEMWYDRPRSSAVPQDVFDRMRPSFYSYRSMDSGQYFDSVAITTKDFRIEQSKRWIASLAPQMSRNKASAAKAVLTRGRK
jgi:hypothetical protein